MTTRAAVRRSLLNALLDLERVDDAALDHAFQHAQRAAFLILDLRGSSRPIPLDRPSAPPTTLPPATAGLHADGRSEVPQAEPPGQTATTVSPHKVSGNPVRGGGNPL